MKTLQNFSVWFMVCLFFVYGVTFMLLFFGKVNEINELKKESETQQTYITYIETKLNSYFGIVQSIDSVLSVNNFSRTAFIEQVEEVEHTEPITQTETVRRQTTTNETIDLTSSELSIEDRKSLRQYYGTMEASQGFHNEFKIFQQWKDENIPDASEIAFKWITNILTEEEE